eukprot:2574590-Pyramimonas_sp.AAC.1
MTLPLDRSTVASACQSIIWGCSIALVTPYTVSFLLPPDVVQSLPDWLSQLAQPLKLVPQFQRRLARAEDHLDGVAGSPVAWNFWAALGPRAGIG